MIMQVAEDMIQRTSVEIMLIIMAYMYACQEGCSLGIRDQRILHLLHGILQQTFNNQ